MELKTANSLAFLTLLILLQISCSKNSSEMKIQDTNFSECYSQNEWDSLKIKNQLIGEWKWKFKRCVSGFELTDNEQDLAIKFYSNGSLDVIRDTAIVQTSAWHIHLNDSPFSDLFEIIEEPNVSELFGNIFICDGKLKMDGAYIDICNNYFEKIN